MQIGDIFHISLDKITINIPPNLLNQKKYTSTKDGEPNGPNDSSGENKLKVTIAIKAVAKDGTAKVKERRIDKKFAGVAH